MRRLPPTPPNPPNSLPRRQKKSVDKCTADEIVNRAGRFCRRGVMPMKYRAELH